MTLPNKKLRANYPQDEDDAVSPINSNSGLKLEEVENTSRFPADNVREVWLNVFEKLDPEDKPAFFRALPEWHDWTRRYSRPRFLIQEVAPIIMESLPEKVTLKTREICRSWTHEFDEQYLEHPVRLYLSFEIAHRNNTFPEHVNRFYSTQALQTFMEEMGNHPGNPFPWGNLEFEWWEPREWSFPQHEQELTRLYAEYWRIAKLLIVKFGTHVRYLRISVPPTNYLGLEILSIFRNLLLLVPNLKRLSICGVFELTSEQIQSYFKRHPLPILEKLEVVDSYLTECALISAVLNSCCLLDNMKRLSIDDSEDKLGLPKVVKFFKNLEVLKADIYFKDLIGLSSSKLRVPPLKELEISFLTEPVRFNKVFKALLPFGDSLVHFMCENMLVGKNWRQIAGMNLYFPNLMSLEFPSYSGPLEPLLQFNKLTHLEIYNEYCQDPEKLRLAEKDVVDFYGFERRMYQSNIWRLFPFLQKLRLLNDIYNRHEYEQTLQPNFNGSFKTSLDCLIDFTNLLEKYQPK